MESAEEKTVEVDFGDLGVDGFEADPLVDEGPADEAQAAVKFDPAIAADSADGPGGGIGRGWWYGRELER
jgi:hypothetical protein